MRAEQGSRASAQWRTGGGGRQVAGTGHSPAECPAVEPTHSCPSGPWQLPEGRAHHPKPQSTRQVLTKPIRTDSRDKCETPRRLHFSQMSVFPLPEPEGPFADQQETSSEGLQGKAEFLHPVIRTHPVGLSLIHERDLDV